MTDSRSGSEPGLRLDEVQEVAVQHELDRLVAATKCIDERDEMRLQIVVAIVEHAGRDVEVAEHHECRVHVVLGLRTFIQRVPIVGAGNRKAP